jgi:hypothetical protein
MTMATDTIKQALERRGQLKRIILPPALDELLAALVTDNAVPDAGDAAGAVTLAGRKQLGFLALDLTLPPDPLQYKLVSDADGFRFWLELNSAAPARKVFEFAMTSPGAVLTAATRNTAGDEEFLEPATGDVSITGLAVALLAEGRAGQVASLSLSPTVGQPAGIVGLGLSPPTVLLGSSGFGIEFGTAEAENGLVIDTSGDDAAPGQTILNGAPLPMRADDPAWRGMIARHLRFYLPRGVPWLGGHAVDACFEIGMGAGEGIDLVLATSVPAKEGRPAIAVTIECRDPAATGLQDFLPTLVEASMELPLDDKQLDVAGAGDGFRIAAGKPVIARARYSRSSADPVSVVTLSVESQGPDGVLSVVAPEGGTTAKVLITAAALATALVADQPPAGADAGGTVLHTLLVAALGLSTCLKDRGRFTIHKVELSSSGHGAPVGKQVALRIDYSVDVLVKSIDIGVLQVNMRDEQPMRVRNRNVALTINLDGGGTDAVKLDFREADMEIEDPGAWMVKSPGSLFDILGTRSGRGSTWLEVDLRFKLNLGPVTVNGATIRATLVPDQGIEASLRGLDARLAIPGLVDGGGRLALLDGGGIDAALDVSVTPLNLRADGSFLYMPLDGGGYWLFVRLGVDLPGPVPIANTGLGVYGIAGDLGINAVPKGPGPGEPDPIGYQLRWDPKEPLKSFEPHADELTFGAEAVLGTVPDLGFAFSCRGGLFISVPDVAVRGVLWGKVMGTRLGVSESPPAGADAGLSFKGVVVVDPADGVTIALKGELAVPVLLDVVVPLGAYFPFGAKRADDWFIYLGSDGYAAQPPDPPDGRAMGPMRVTVLPGLLDQHADAYLMLRGRGIRKWPRGGPVTVDDGLVIAFGFGFEFKIGLEPVIWAEVHAGADLLLATHPMTLAGFGSAGGSLNLGPFSIGVDAQLSLLAVEHADPYIHAELCGHIDLFFTELEGCVSVSLHNEPRIAVPMPDMHPLDVVENGVIVGDRAYLVDDQYRRVGSLVRSPDAITDKDRVWPDTLLHLAFAVSPVPAPNFVAQVGGAAQFSGIDQYPCGVAAQPVGGAMLRYQWTLAGLALLDVTDDPHGAGVPVPGPFAAAWQAGNDGETGSRPQGGDLVLLTYRDDLRLERLADGGAQLPVDPLARAADACQRKVVAKPGWALGYQALPTSQGFSLQPERISPDPCVSRVTATLVQVAQPLGRVGLTLATAALLPQPYGLVAPASERFATPVAADVPFEGALRLAALDGAPMLSSIGRSWQDARITPEVPLTDARLWLLVRPAPDQGQLPLAVVQDPDGGQWQERARIALADRRIALCFAPDNAVAIKTIEVTWPAGKPFWVLGLGGVTADALAAASLRNAAVQAEATRQATAAALQPQPPEVSNGDGAHGILKPGRVYRLDVNLTWDGWVRRQDEQGNAVDAGYVGNQTAYLPKGAAPASPPDTARHYFFATAPRVMPSPGPAQGAPAPAATLAARYGLPDYIAARHLRRDLFEPAMLERFLLGYTPSQSETARFCDDPLNARFSAAHVAALAKMYGFTLVLGLRRVDAAGADGDEHLLDAAWLELRASAGLSPAARRRAEVAANAPCRLPKAGATLQPRHPPPPLAPLAWYEVYVLAQPDEQATYVDGRLEGVSFRTSRWRNPVEMMAGIGFGGDGGQPSGDIEVAAAAPGGPPVIDGSDADFEAALDAIGLRGWPPATAPRTSLLWRRAPGDGPAAWQCAGLLLESPEPVDRPGRLEIASLGVTMEPAPAGALDIRRSDRSRSRVLWLCSTPFTPRARVLPPPAPPAGLLPTLVLALQDLDAGAAVSGSMLLPLVPAFAKET